MNGITAVFIAFFVIGLPTMAIFALVSRILRHREKRMELEAQIAAAQAAATNPRPDLLEQRVRVLERIVTDKGMNVAEEIERLRDERVG
jgi:hypothetical protein